MFGKFDFGLTPDEGRQAAAGRGLQAITRRGCAGQFERVDGSRKTFDLERTQWAHFDETFHLAQSLRGHRDSSSSGEGFHTRGEMGGLAEGGIVDVEIVGQRADHHFTGVDADANLQRRRLNQFAVLVAIAAQFRLHRQRRITCAQGVIFVR